MWSRIPALAVACCSAAIALALATAPGGVADSEALDGVYIRTIIDAGDGLPAGKTNTVTFTPCGPDCTHWEIEGGQPGGFDLYRHGDKWVKSPEAGAMVIIDGITLKGSAASTSGLPWFMTFQLAKVS
jgi:hypothetical protein